MIPQLKCNVIDISQRTDPMEILDLDALIPSTTIEENQIEFVKELEHKRSEKIGMDSLPEDLFNQVLETCYEQGGYIGCRDALYFILQSNWGVRFSDAIIVKRIDFINDEGKFRDSCLFSELKTGKPRTMYINDTIKMALLMVLWNGDFAPLDYLIVSDWRNKNYLKLKDENGKCVRRNGKFVYLTDDNGNKIPQPLEYHRARNIMVKKLVDDLGVNLKNVSRCEGGKLKLATHSLRKLYTQKVQQVFMEMYGELGQAHTASMEFLNWDLNHSSIQTTSRYCGDFEACKCQINMGMKLGYDVVKKYFDLEKAKHFTQSSHD